MYYVYNYTNFKVLKYVLTHFNINLHYICSYDINLHYICSYNTLYNKLYNMYGNNNNIKYSNKLCGTIIKNINLTNDQIIDEYYNSFSLRILLHNIFVFNFKLTKYLLKKYNCILKYLESFSKYNYEYKYLAKSIAFKIKLNTHNYDYPTLFKLIYI